jgi:hypothetical protein
VARDGELPEPGADHFEVNSVCQFLMSVTFAGSEVARFTRNR